MKRTKWLKIEVGCSHKELIAGISTSEFSGDVGHGFDLQFRDDNQLRAKFIEKIENVEVVVDPFGMTTNIETTRYSFVEFRLTAVAGRDRSRYLVEVDSPPRTLRALIRALSVATTGLTVSEIQLPLLSIFEELQINSVSAQLTRIKASQLKLTADSVAKIDVTSKKDAASDLQAFFGEKAVSIDKIRVDRPFAPSPHFMEISSNGLVCVDETYSDLASDFILNRLIKYYARSTE